MDPSAHVQTLLELQAAAEQQQQQQQEGQLSYSMGTHLQERNICVYAYMDI